MKKSIFAALAASVFVFSLTVSQTATAGVPSFSGDCKKKLTAEQCTKLRSDLDRYIDYITAWLAAQPAAKRAKLQRFVDFAIKEANRVVNRLCPAPPVNTCQLNCQASYDAEVLVCNATFDPAVCGGNLVCEAGITDQRAECIGVASETLNACNLTCSP
jgi:hypothetical protein